MKNYYEILEIQPTATLEQIKAQYHLMLLAWHPDRFPNSDQKAKAEEKTKQINEAYRVLCNQVKHENDAKAEARREAEEKRRKAAQEEIRRRDAEKAREDEERVLRERQRKVQEERAHQQRLEEERKQQAEAAKRKASETKVQQERPCGNEMTLTLAPGVEMIFMRVPAGEFLMGSDPGKDEFAREDEQPQHSVFLDEFWMGKYPVTNRQYAVYVKAEAVARSHHWAKGKNLTGGEDHPVVNVTWHAARDFCRWASDACGQTIRLPSEAEWEKAARGTNGRVYPWGRREPDAELCNYDRNVGYTTRVGRYSPQGDSPYGCADIAGNVWEWTRSLWGKEFVKPDYGYPYRAVDGRENEDAPEDVPRVMRGGSWLNNRRLARCANRNRDVPDNFTLSVGFRVLSPGIVLNSGP